MTIGKSTEEQYIKQLKYILDAGIDYTNIVDINAYIKSVSNMRKSDGTIKNDSSIKNALVATLWYVRNNSVKYADYINIERALRLQIEVLSARINKQVNTNELTDAQLKTYMDWTEILEIYLKLKANYKLSKSNHMRYVLLSLYVLIPPRRLLDYTLMHIIDNTDINKINNDLNYYIPNKKTFIFNNYKTKKFYGQQTIIIPNILANILDEYIAKYKITGSLFNKKKTTLRACLTSIFYAFSDRKLSVNILRHSYITYMKDTGKLNGLERVISTAMAHTIDTQISYYKKTTNNINCDMNNINIVDNVICLSGI